MDIKLNLERVIAICELPKFDYKVSNIIIAVNSL